MIQIDHLTKSFNGRAALKGLDLTLDAGEIFGLLGPNGAGKTTTIKILAGLLSFDSGKITIGGQNFNNNNPELKRMIAYVPDEPFVYPKLTGEEHLHFFADLYGKPVNNRQAKIDFFFRYFEFELYRNELVESYSSGTRQKLLISQALLVEPALLLLDEPLVSIDPVVGRKFKEYLKKIAREGTTVIFATHILPLAREVSTRIGIIIDGRISIQGEPSRLEEMSGSKDLEEFYFEQIMSHESPSP